MEHARNRFELAVRVEPENVFARNNFALVLSHLGRVQEAKFQLETVLSQEPQNPNAHVNLGILLKKTGEHSHAQDHLIAALQSISADQYARSRVSRLNQQLETPQKKIAIKLRVFDALVEYWCNNIVSR